VFCPFRKTSRDTNIPAFKTHHLVVTNSAGLFNRELVKVEIKRRRGAKLEHGGQRWKGRGRE